MRRRFFVDQVRNGQAEILGDDAKHLSRVLRAEAGQVYEISDNRNVYLAEIETARKDRVIFRAMERLEATPPLPLTLCAALFKFDRFEWMIEKATELGVAEVVPFESERTERGLERAAVKRVDRWRRIALEASQQSRRAILPEVQAPVSFEDALSVQAERRWVLDESQGGRRWAGGAGKSAAILIGPEGGWADRERATFVAAGWTPISMGPLILRAETAAIAALTIAAATLQT
jgi:16S rRNA (uracil1498-N3)-methyltransferase